MKHKFQHKIKALLAVAAVCTLTFSCSKWDDFKKYKEGGEIIYTGKLDSVKFLSGNQRIRLKAMLKADPKLTKVKVLWNGGKDSIVYDVDMQAEPREFIRTFPMEEGIKNFVVYTYDAAGNQSVAVNAVGQVYGPRYQNGLNNRVVSSASSLVDTTKIDWLPIDLSAGPIATEVTYLSKTGIKKVLTPIAQERTIIGDLDASAATISYRTLFKPQPTSIDTFYTEPVEVKVTKEYLRNTKIPFETVLNSDRWAIPKYWKTNAAVLNFTNGAGTKFGGVDFWFGGPQLAMEAGWSSDNMVTITNGKIYQTAELPAGNYTLEMDIPDCTQNGNFYTVAAEGSIIPDIENLSSAISYAKTSTTGTHKISFKLTSTKTVSMGFVGTLQNKGCCDGTFWRISAVRLKQLPLE
ncbi:DUF5013 domain-containing protein [Mucilaginibacter sp. UR6-1]|uniref:DUF4998 domain-containing protein n=1 Tax=Mucilaginibacter sp. UR6-1 TaxID=1435643 RepID=UPI001E46AC91|nr:DUF4998 domain-containing protein [Mucilaginibacter sp. UR6-1]MCC8407443.1 DUF5013 domain-containing protein [Mucilaginibacter sp. UR6-1]